ncbi:PREDICTED: metabotropic glutamate receptor 2-like, partial [Priapulus caudatus]|uniref:Metabotropic glutamate receptor 2-like n=1 Tax=Priapulus caudatus TaxID=37621 RepID=A0ABM1F8K4_PRICU
MPLDRMILACLLSSVGGVYVPGRPQYVAESPGDLVLAGLFPIHKSASPGYCRPVLRSGGFYVPYAYSMMHAIHRVNDDPAILPNITLGYRIADSCGKDTAALAHALDFVRLSPTGDDSAPPPPVVGVVGGSYSSVTKLSGYLMTMFHVPQISYTATSDALSDKSVYTYQLRTIVPNRVFLQAIMDVIAYFRWSYVSLLYIDDEYGTDGQRYISKQADRLGVCFAVKERVNYSMTASHFDRMAGMLLQRPQAKVVIVLSYRSSRNGPDLMEALRRRNAIHDFIFVAPTLGRV